MNSYRAALAASAFIIIISLFIDLIFYRRKHPVFMSNQNHVNLYILPIIISYSIFTVAVLQKSTESFFSVLILVIFGLGYVHLIIKDKIVLKGAEINSVIEELNKFMKIQEKNYKINHVTEHLYNVEINNYQNAMTVRDMEKWVEIDTIIHKDDKFLEDLDRYFMERAPEMPSPLLRPNIFFYLLIIFTLLSFGMMMYYM